MLKDRIKTIFVGTPEFSVPYLAGLLSDADFEVVGVITQPDKPSGRKQKLTPSPIKLAAQSAGLKVWKPEKLRHDTTIINDLKSAGASLLVVVAYGQIIPQSILDLFPLGAINVHPSLLPKYRGASPIQNAILHGDDETGISIMLMDAQMDHGPILAQKRHDLTGEETNASLHEEFAAIGVPLLISAIKGYLGHTIVPQAQNDAEATYCEMISQDQARIDWTKSATAIRQQIYAFFPWPATWTMLGEERFKILPPAEILASSTKASGTIEIADSKLLVHCGEGRLLINKVQPAGKKEMSAQDFMHGHKTLNGLILK